MTVNNYSMTMNDLSYERITFLYAKERIFRLRGNNISAYGIVHWQPV